MQPKQSLGSVCVCDLWECLSVFHQKLHPERSPALLPVSPQLALPTLRCLKVVNTMHIHSGVGFMCINNILYYLCTLSYTLHTDKFIDVHLMSITVCGGFRIYSESSLTDHKPGKAVICVYNLTWTS